MNDDAELLRRYAKAGDETAFADLVRRHLSLVYHTALRHVDGDAHAAQDISQAVFTELARKARILLRYPALGGWLYARSRYASLDLRRSRQRRRHREEQAHLMNEAATGGDPTPDWERLRPVIDQVMHGLSESDRNAVYLRYFEGRPFSEVGARFGLSEEAARKRVDRAMEKLSRSLKNLGVTSTTGAVALAIAEQAGAAAPIGLADAISGAAVAASGGPSSGLVALYHLMSTSHAVIGAALGALSLMVGFSAYEQTVIHEARVALAREASQRTTAAQELGQLQQQAVPTDGDDMTVSRHSGSLPRNSAAVLPGQNKAGLPRPTLVPGTQRWSTNDVDRELIKDAEVQKYFKQGFFTLWSAVYGPLFNSAGWSAAEIAALENLKLQQNQNVGSAVLTLRPDDETGSQIRQSMQGLLGDSGYQQYEQYDRTAWAGGLVSSSLAGNLYDSGTPLTTDQANQLTQILSTSTGEVYSHAANINWTIALPEAQEILSPSQYAVLQNIAALMSSVPPGAINGGIPGLAPGTFGNSITPPSAHLAASNAPPQK